MSDRAAISAAVALAAALALILATAAEARRHPPPPPPPPPPPSIQGPTNLRITATTERSISLAWDAPNGNGGTWWYCLQRDGLGCIRIDPPATTYTVGYLWPNTTFNYSLVAVSSAGRSAPSNTVTYTTPPDVTPPTTPTLSTTGVWPTRVGASWTRSVDNVSQVWYTLFLNGEPYLADLLGFQSYLLLYRSPETQYELQVTARDYFGNIAESNVVTVTTPAVTETEPPTAPTNLTLSSESSPPEIWLDWTQSTDNSDPQSQILYEVFINGVFVEPAAVGYGSTVTYCVGEGPNTVTIRAVDTSGNASGFSNAVVFC